MTVCEDCRDTCKRRTRCKMCGKKVCAWCSNHVHNKFVQNWVKHRKALAKRRAPCKL